MSGQLVNYHKSAFQCTSNVSEQQISDFKTILAMEYVTSLDSYLGCPIIDKRVNANTFEKIITNTNNQLAKWKANTVSQAGRTTLIKSCLATKPNHQMQSFTLPSSTLVNIDKICRNFFWNRDPTASTPNLIGWDRICKPKYLGGLGLRKAEVNNKAMQMKLLWRILMDPSNLWVQLVTKKYLKSKTLFDYAPSQSSSWQWRNLMKLRPIFSKGLQWKVGNGKTIQFWKDSWILPYPLLDIIPTCTNPNQRVEEFILPNKNWNIDALKVCLPDHLVQSISHTPIPSNDIQDAMYWRLTPNGEFSTKSAALLIQGITPENIQKCSYRWIWKLNVPPKVSNFIWKICNDGLPTKERLFRSHVSVPLECVFCSHHTETTNHLFLNCPFTLDLFKAIARSFKWPRCWEMTFQTEEMVEVLNKLRASMTSEEIQKVMIGWWFIWFFRNKVCFNEEAINIQNAALIIINFCEAWSNSLDEDVGGNPSSKGAPTHHQTNYPISVAWTPPSP